MKRLLELLSKLPFLKKSKDMQPTQQTSRLKKKLLLYFILIAVVSISVSLEIIIEISETSFQSEIASRFEKQYIAGVDENRAADIEAITKNLNYKEVFWPIYDLRNRMLLLLMLITGSIITAFFMFTKDIVTPMDNMVAATKKLADGDLTVTVPVMSEDEMGQVAELINDMNAKLLDMINQLKIDINRHKETLSLITEQMTALMPDAKGDEIVEDKKMRLSDFKGLVKNIDNCTKLLQEMSIDFASLETFINMYKTYQMSKDISDSEILEALEEYNTNA